MASSGSGGSSSGRSAPPPRPPRAGSGNQRGGGPKRGKSPVGSARRAAPTMRTRQVPWLAIGAVALVLVLVAVIGFFLLRTNEEVSARDAALAPFRPTAENQDPAAQIPGVVSQPYAGQYHVTADQRVNYDQSPPFGGPHDAYWAACTGTVYDQPIRTENLVHSLEHGAVWVTYNPDQVTGPALTALQDRVSGTQYMAISPYPGLDQPIALLSWGHQLKLADPNDPRIEQFIAASLQNPYQHPEVGASCDALGPGFFDPANPPPFEPLPATGPNAVGMDFQGRG